MSAPATIDEFQARLVQVSESLPKRLLQCADYIAQNTDRIAVSTVAELATGAGVQPSAFMRFCQLMGFQGFSDMQRMFRENYGPRWPDYSTRLENLRAGGADSPTALLAEFVEAGRASLGNLAATVDEQALEAAVDVLAGAQMIHLIGLRRAFPIACYLTYAFEKMGIPAMLHDGVGNLNHRHALRPGDAVLAITFAPYTQDTIDMARHAAHAGHPVVAITDALNSPLHRIGATTLVVSELDVGAFRTLSAALTLALTLSVAVGAKRR
ncbi:MurR/RpiR family transcriptional regulator [Neogemmobacter tilapiae]|uniref:RpiR family transcriptional regulator n=1 Tax=Neogemmobacter tilapiae TaxID=875041 RepID=A0A918WIN9_9RHOB|nr:MurR/RpiR family transcriptional regulator [Gemmobacter tilapiae]GHC55144.1 RpiR family transcriptional regulator [Gemmobacter tilapiae]